MNKVELGTKVSRGVRCVLYVASKQPEDEAVRQMVFVLKTTQHLLDSSDDYIGAKYLVASAVLGRVLKRTSYNIEDIGVSNGILLALRGAMEDAITAACQYITWVNFPLRRAQAIADKADSAIVTADAILEAQLGYTFAPVTEWPVGEEDDAPISQVAPTEKQCRGEDWLVDNISYGGVVVRRAGESIQCTRAEHSMGPHVVHAADGKPIHIWFSRVVTNAQTEE